MSVVSISEVNPEINKSTCIKNHKTDLEEDTSDSEKIDAELESTLYQCPVCKDDIRFSVEDLRGHYREAHKRKWLPPILYSDTWSCEVCGKKFYSRSGIREHMKAHDSRIYCDVCGITHKKLIDYVLHRRIHSDETQFKCVFCEYTSDCWKQITEHVNKQHDMTHKYHCTKCNKGFPFLTWLQEHDNYHTGAKPYVCDLCGKAFPYSRYLPVHRKFMHKDELPDDASLHSCVVCKKQYHHKNNLKLHMITHTGNHAICDICGKVLSNMEMLKFHMRLHTGYKPFSCDFCGKCFTKKQILTEHIRVHTGEKPYVCEYCSKAFSQKSSLRIHVRSHTGERPHVCYVCNKGFASKAMLNIHLKAIHHLI